MSQLQLDALADGEVSRDEYDAVFRDYRACIEENGKELVDVRWDGSRYRFGIPPGADPDDKCYMSRFDQVDTVWQTAHLDESPEADELRACLKNSGIEPAATYEDMANQLLGAGLDWEQCQKIGMTTS